MLKRIENLKDNTLVFEAIGTVTGGRLRKDSNTSFGRGIAKI